jgi:DNA-binding protein HU-beta
MSNKINNSDFIRLISKKTKYAQKDVAEVLNSAAEIITDKLKDGDSVAVFKGVTFKSKYCEERVGRNPQTGDPVIIKAHYSPKVQFGKKWKEDLM